MPLPALNRFDPTDPQQLAMLGGIVIRNDLEAIHAEITDPTMRHINRSVRNGFYTTLRAAAAMDRSAVARNWVNYQLEMVPQYWEDPRLLEGYLAGFRKRRQDVPEPSAEPLGLLRLAFLPREVTPEIQALEMARRWQALHPHHPVTLLQEVYDSFLHLYRGLERQAQQHPAQPLSIARIAEGHFKILLAQYEHSARPKPSGDAEKEMRL